LAQADNEPDAVRRAAILARAEQTMLDDEGIAALVAEAVRPSPVSRVA
jgi:hypothetical protein